MSFDAHGTMYAEAPPTCITPAGQAPVLPGGQRFDRSVVEHLERFRLILDHGTSLSKSTAAITMHEWAPQDSLASALASSTRSDYFPGVEYTVRPRDHTLQPPRSIHDIQAPGFAGELLTIPRSSVSLSISSSSSWVHCHGRAEYTAGLPSIRLAQASLPSMSPTPMSASSTRSSLAFSHRYQLHLFLFPASAGMEESCRDDLSPASHGLESRPECTLSFLV